MLLEQGVNPIPPEILDILDLIRPANGIRTYSIELALTGSFAAKYETRLQIDVPNAIGDESPEYVLRYLRSNNVINSDIFSVYINHAAMMSN